MEVVDAYIDDDDMKDSVTPPPTVTYTAEAAAAQSNGDPLKITMWVAMKSKVLSVADREEMLNRGAIKPPLATQKLVVVAHVDPSRSSDKFLKLYEVHAQVDPDFSKG